MHLANRHKHKRVVATSTGALSSTLGNTCRRCLYMRWGRSVRRSLHGCRCLHKGLTLSMGSRRGVVLGRLGAAERSGHGIAQVRRDGAKLLGG